MSKIILYLSAVFFFTIGQSSAMTIRAAISGPGAWSNGTKIQPNAEFNVDIYSNNNDIIPLTTNRTTWQSSFEFTGDVTVQYLGGTEFDSLATTQFAGFWNVFKNLSFFGWDGALPDSVCITGIAFNSGYPPALGEIKDFSLKFKTANTSGTFCIDSTIINSSYDWLFDDPIPSFSMTCWTVSNPHKTTVSNLNNDGSGSLRAAINTANMNPGPDTVLFAVSGTIPLVSPLPALIDDSTIVLGSSAPGGNWSVMLDGSSISGGGDGLVVQSRDNVIEGLTIRNFPGNGITVAGALSIRNRLTENVIYNNNGLAIDLGANGVTLNDIGDGDSGPNDLFNYPVADSAHMNLDKSFTIYGRSEGNGTVEFYVAHPAGQPGKPADPSGHGEAFSYVGTCSVPGTGMFSFTIPNSIAPFSKISMIALASNGNTSEFSENVSLTPSPLIVVAYSPVHLKVTDPIAFYIGRDSMGVLSQTLFPATYDTTGNDSVTIFYPIQGQYVIEVIREHDAPPGASYSIGIRIDGSEQCILTWDDIAPASGSVDSFFYAVDEGWHYENGDANDNGAVNILDVTFLINFLYKNGPAPYPVTAGDANCNLAVNILDVTFLINYLYRHGPAPCQQ